MADNNLIDTLFKILQQKNPRHEDKTRWELFLTRYLDDLTNSPVVKDGTDFLKIILSLYPKLKDEQQSTMENLLMGMENVIQPAEQSTITDDENDFNI